MNKLKVILFDNKIKIIMSIISISVIGFVYFFTNVKLVKPLTVINDNGYAILDENIEQTLKKSSDSSNSIGTLDIEKNSIIYIFNNDIYNDDLAKNKINNTLPLFTNNNEYIHIINSSGKLINNKFQQLDSYLNMVLNNGHAFNYLNGTLAYEEKIYFYKTSTDIFINSEQITVKTKNSSYVIPKGSIIFFDDNQIKYYSLHGGQFNYNNVSDVSADSTIILGLTDSYSYNQFLLDMRLKDSESKNPNKNPNSDPNSPNGSGTGTGSGNGNGNGTGEGEGTGSGSGSGSGTGEGAGSGSGSGTGTGTGSGSGSGNGNGNGTGEGAGSGSGAGSGGAHTGSGDYETDPYMIEYGIKKEQVEEIIAATKIEFNVKEIGVYRVIGDLKITDPYSVIKSPVNFYVEVNSELKLRRPVHGQGVVELLNLDPDTEMLVYATYSYQIGKKLFSEQQFFKQTLKTKKMDDLTTINVNYTKGPEYSNKIQINNLGISNVLSEETKSAITKISVELHSSTTRALSKAVIANFQLTTSQVNKILNNETIDYTTPEVLKSNTDYNVEFKFYDFRGTVMNGGDNLKEEVVETIRQAPSLTGKITSVSYNKGTLVYTVANPDSVDILSYKYEIYDNNDNFIKSGGLSVSDSSFEITGLDSQKSYKIKLYVSYAYPGGTRPNVNDYYSSSVKITTYPLASIGGIVVKGEQISFTQTTIEHRVSLQPQTDPELLGLLKEIYIKVIKIDDNSVAYTYKLTDSEVKTIKDKDPYTHTATGLSPNTQYRYKLEGKFEENSGALTTMEIQDLNSTYRTLKQNATVERKNLIITSSYISAEYKIVDVNGSIVSEEVKLVVTKTNSSGVESKVYENTIDHKSDSFTNVVINNIEIGSSYKFSFIADKYNTGYTDRTMVNDYEFFTQTLNNDDYIVGEIQIQSLTKNANSSLGKVKYDLKDPSSQATGGKIYVELYKNNVLKDTTTFNISPSSGHNEIKNITFDNDSDYKYISYFYNGDIRYNLDEETFDTRTNIEGISTAEQLKNIDQSNNLNKKYYVLKDINYGTNPTIARFTGVLDFKGYKLRLSNIGANSTRNSLFTAIAYTAEIKNVNILYDEYIDNYSSDFYGFVLNNYGKLTNINVVSNGTKTDNNKNVTALVNSNSGTIDTFSIHFLKPISGITNIASVAISNQGNIRNGIISVSDDYDHIINSTVNDASSGVKVNGGVVAHNKIGGVIDNVFVTKPIKISSSSNSSNVGNIVGNNEGTVKNSISIGNVIGAGIGHGPIIGSSSTFSTLENVYYYAPNVTTNKDQNYIGLGALYMKDILNGILTNNKFVFDGYTNVGYFPKIKFDFDTNDIFYVKLPALNVDAIREPSYIHYKVGVQSEELVNIQFYYLNPMKYSIEDVKLENMNTLDISYEQNGNHTIISANFMVNKYYSFYGLSSISYKTSEFSPTAELSYANNAINIYFDFYKPIRSVSDFKKISASTAENYMLINDLDFDSETDVALSSFTGKFNGNGKTISNYTVQKAKPGLFGTLTGKALIENLKLDRVRYSDYVDDDKVGGVVAVNLNSATIKNVHIQKSDLKANRNFGGIVGVLEIGNISESSLTDSKITIKSNGSNIGSLVGSIKGNSSGVYNSFASDVEIVEEANATNIRSVGGIAGDISDYANIQNCYFHAKTTIHLNGENIGGIVGTLNKTSYVGRVYSYVDIIANNNIGGLIGKLEGGSNPTNKQNISGFALGDLVTMVGSDVHSTVDSYGGSKPYTIDSQIINGTLSNDPDSTKAAKSNFANFRFYEQTIGFWDNFSYGRVSDYILPKVNSLSGNVVQNQRDILIEKSIFYIEDISYENLDDGKDSKSVDLVIKIKNPESLPIINLETDSDLITYPGTINQTQHDDITIVKIKAVPVKNLSSYKLKTIIYGNDNKTFMTNMDINVDFHTFVSDAIEFIDAATNRPNENILIGNDIDFVSSTKTSWNLNLKNLKGLKKSDGTRPAFKNLKLDVKRNNPFIQSVVKLTDIAFDNIEATVHDTHTSIFIKELNGNNVDGLEFRNVTVKAPNNNLNGVSFIYDIKGKSNVKNVVIDNYKVEKANNSSGSDNDSSIFSSNIDEESVIDGIAIKDSAFNASSNSGAITRYLKGNSTVTNIVVDNLSADSYIVGVGAGMLFYSAENSTISNLQFKNSVFDQKSSDTESRLYSGVVSYARSAVLSNFDLDNIEIKRFLNGLSMIASNSISTTMKDISIKNSKINSGANNGAVSAVVSAHVDSSTFTNIALNNTRISAAWNTVGGFFNTIKGTVVLENAYANGLHINSGNNDIFKLGIVASEQQSGILKINNLYFEGTVNGPHIGGLVAVGKGGYIEASNIHIGGRFGINKANSSSFGYVIGEAQSTSYKDSVISNFLVTGSVSYNSDSQANYNPITDNLIGYMRYKQNLTPGSPDDQRIGYFTVSNFYVYENSTINDKKVSEMPNSDLAKNPNQVINKLTTAQLSSKDTYTNNIGWSEQNWDFSPLENTPANYPKLYKKGETGTLIPNQADIKVIGTTRRARSIAGLGLDLSLPISLPVSDFNVYQSDVDKINVEFESLNTGMVLEMIVNGEVKSSFDVKQKVYTFNYNFKDDFKVSVVTGTDEITKDFVAYDLQKSISTYGSEYYYKYNDELQTSSRGKVEGNFLNLNGKYGLNDDGQVIDLETGDLVRNVAENISVALLTPLHSFVYNNSNIDVFNTFSTITKDGVEETVDMLLFVSNNSLQILNPNSQISQYNYVIASDLDKNYQSILTNDGVILDLKDKIQKPSLFKNENIKDIAYNFNSSNNMVLVLYEDGEVEGFNFITGEEIFKTKEESFLSFLVSSISNFNLFGESENKEYKESLVMEKYLNSLTKDVQASIDEKSNFDSNAMGGSGEFADGDGQQVTNTNSNSTSNSNGNSGVSVNKNTNSVKLVNGLSSPYTLVYNFDNKEYEALKIEEVISSGTQAAPKNEVLNADIAFIEIQKSTEKTIAKALEDKSIILYISVFVLVSIGAYTLYKRSKKFR